MRLLFLTLMFAAHLQVSCGARSANYETTDVAFPSANRVVFMDTSTNTIQIRQCRDSARRPLTRNCPGENLAEPMGLETFKTFHGLLFNEFTADEAGLVAARAAHANSQGWEKSRIAVVIFFLKTFLEQPAERISTFQGFLANLASGESVEIGNSAMHDLLMQAFNTQACTSDYQTVFAEPSFIGCIMRKIERLSVSNPKEALVYAAQQVMYESSLKFAASGLINSNARPTDQDIVAGVLYYHKPWDEFAKFWTVAHKLRSRVEVGEAEVLEALALSKPVVQKLYTIYGDRTIVHHPGVEVYSEAECKNVRPYIKGLMLKTVKRSGEINDYSVHPTYSSHQTPGMVVAWDWMNNGETIHDSWVKDPDTQQVKYVWSSSHIFRGRALRDFSRH